MSSSASIMRTSAASRWARLAGMGPPPFQPSLLPHCPSTSLPLPFSDWRVGASLSYLFYCERLFKNGLRTTLPTSFRQGRAGVGGVDDDRHVLAGCPLAVSDGSEHGFARDVRQADVEKNAVVVLLGGQFQGFIAGIRKINLKS